MAEETYDFGDFAPQREEASNQRPTGDYSPIDDVINKPIWVTGYATGVQTHGGTDKSNLIKFKWELDEAETAFWTRSRKLIEMVQDPAIRFPFRTIIKVVLIRELCGFEYRSAKEAVSKEDEAAYNMYLVRKRGYMRGRH